MCSTPECERTTIARGLCSLHYQRAKKAGFEPLLRQADVACRAPGCDRSAIAKGLCKAHYDRVARLGDLLVEKPIQGRDRERACVMEGCEKRGTRRGMCSRHYWQAVERPECSIDGCSERVHARGWCCRHYQRWRKFGDPIAGLPEKRRQGAGLGQWGYWQRRDEQRLAADPELREYVEILKRDPCSYCDDACEHIDHIVPVDAGGILVVDNLTASCQRCNVRKSAIPLLLSLLRRRPS